MKKFYYPLSILLVPIALLLMSYHTGSPGGKTGSPGDNGSTCTQCHTGTANNFFGWITNNIPTSGYTPGQTYTITATGTYQGVVRFGFELTTENSSGNKVGTFQITDPTRTKLVNGNHAVTHTANGIFPTGNSCSWSMDWVAPAAGTGTVGIYAAFNAANGNGNTTGDVIFKGSVMVSEAVPAIESILPDQAMQGDNFPVQIIGINTQWSGNPSVSLSFHDNPSEIIYGDSINVLNSTELIVDFSFPDFASTGMWDLHVNNLVLENAFTIIEGFPRISNIEPNSAFQGESMTLTISGVHTMFTQTNPEVTFKFHNDTTETFTATSVNIINDTLIEADLDIPQQASVGLWEVHVGDLNFYNGFVILLSTGLPEDAPSFSYEIFPNPTHGTLLLRSNTNCLLKISDLSGRVLINRKISAELNNIDLSSFPDGIYLVYLDNNKNKIVKKILLKKN